jgi:hypothetical protein
MLDVRHLSQIIRMEIYLMAPVPNHAARGVLRIEITRDAERELRMAMMPYSYPNHTPGDIPPTMFEGVSVYTVNHTLPECGWRVINPLRRMAAVAP